MGILEQGTMVVKTTRQTARGSMMRPREWTDPDRKAVHNLILLSLPDEEYNALRPHLERVDLPQHEILHEPGAKIEFVYFLNEGMTSIVALSGDGRSVEVGIVGKEGMVGMALTIGLRRSAFRAIMQIAGNGVRVRSDIFHDVLLYGSTLRTKLSRFGLLHGMQVAQLTACNRLHEVEQRLARWLLMCQDHVESGSLFLTHEFLSQMLGTGRPSVSLAVASLANAGLIENGRGSVKILNRKGLAEVACECYGVIQNFDGRMGLK